MPHKYVTVNILCKPNTCLENVIFIKMTGNFCNFDALMMVDDICVYVDNYVETVDYFSKTL